MNYTKPAIMLTAVAKSAIQGIPKSAFPADNTPTAVTSGAYEADE
jgi:hypothetical protein